MSGKKLENKKENKKDHGVEAKENTGKNIHDQTKNQSQDRTFIDIEICAKENNKQEQKVGPAKPFRQKTQ